MASNLIVVLTVPGGRGSATSLPRSMLLASKNRVKERAVTGSRSSRPTTTDRSSGHPPAGSAIDTSRSHLDELATIAGSPHEHCAGGMSVMPWKARTSSCT